MNTSYKLGHPTVHSS